MAELSPELIEKLAAALESVAERLGKSSSKIEAELYKSAALEKSRVAREQAQSGQLKKTFDDLKKAASEGTVPLKEYNEEVKKLKETTDRLPDSFNDLKKEVDQASAKVTFSFDSIKENAGKLAGGLATAGAGIAKTTIDVFKQAQSGASGFQMAGSVMSAGIGAAGKGLETTGSLASSAGQAVSGLGKAGKFAGAALQVFGSVTSAAGKSAPIVKEGFDLLVNQLEIVNKSYDSVVSSGALFADAMTGMKNTAKDLRLSQAELAQVVSQNKEAFIGTGLGVEGASKKMAMVSKAAPDLAGKLFNLGLSAQEQVEVQARVMADMNRAGTLQGSSNKDVADQTEKYAKNLRVIAAITGDDAKARMEEARQRMNNLAVQAKVIEQRQKGDTEAYQRYQTAIAALPKSGSKLATEILGAGDVVASETGTNLALLGDAGITLRDGLKHIRENANMSSDEAAQYVQDMRATMRRQLEANPEALKQLGIIAQQGGPLAGAAEFVSDMFAETAKNTGQTGKDLNDQVTKMANTTDELTKNIKASSDAAQDFKVLVDQKLTGAAAQLSAVFPDVIKGMTSFVDSLTSAIAKITGNSGTANAVTSGNVMSDRAIEAAQTTAGMGLAAAGTMAGASPVGNLAAGATALGALQMGAIAGTPHGQAYMQALREDKSGMLGAGNPDMAFGTAIMGADQTPPPKDVFWDTVLGWFGKKPPSMASGGIVDGPATGYPVVLHGKELIIPLDEQPNLGSESNQSPANIANRTYDETMTINTPISNTESSKDLALIAQSMAALTTQMDDLLRATRDVVANTERTARGVA